MLQHKKRAMKSRFGNLKQERFGMPVVDGPSADRLKVVAEHPIRPKFSEQRAALQTG